MFMPTDLRNSPCQQVLKNEIRKVYDMPDKPTLYFSTGIRIANTVKIIYNSIQTVIC